MYGILIDGIWSGFIIELQNNLNGDGDGKISVVNLQPYIRSKGKVKL